MGKDEINEQYLNIKDQTVSHMKDLLKDIKIYKHEQFEQKIKQLEKELKEIKKAKKYWLVWEEKEEYFDKETVWKLPVLEEVKEKSIIQDNSENNILIEWDNYHTLSVLNYTHAWKIDVIYIDPPYNTWNNDFIYNDKIVDKEDKFRHSKWLSFLNKRLKLAKNLLSKKWVIFISIDDNEFAQLKLLCDEIFWIENFVEVFCWNKTKTPPSLSNKTRSNIEYILCYEKIKNSNKYFWKKSWNSDAPLLNTWNWINKLIFPVWTIKFSIKDWSYKKWNYPSLKILEDFEVKNWINITELVAEWEFKWWQENLNLEINNWTYLLIKSEKFSIRYQKKDEYVNNMLPNKLIDNTFDVWTNEEATKELWNIWIDFTFPKPVSLLKFLTSMVADYSNNFTVLDFFAWSWTTWHAVLELNKQDWWNRKFILATNNENNICEEVTYERIKKVIRWYKNLKWENVEWLWWNLTYLKTAFIDKSNVNDDLRVKMVNRCSELLCLKENIWNEIKQANDKIKIFERHDKYLAILYDMFFFDDFKEVLKTLNKPLSIYAFSHYKLNKRDFDNLDIDFEIEQIPDPILEVYENIFWL